MALFKQKPYYFKKKKEYQGIWVPKTWYGMTSFYGDRIWTDGTDIYYAETSQAQKKLERSSSTWSNIRWETNYYPSYGYQVWTYKGHVLFSENATHLEFDKTTKKKWKLASGIASSVTSMYGKNIWTDGIDYYYSYSYDTYRWQHLKMSDYSSSYTDGELHLSWSDTAGFTGSPDFSGADVWTDGEKIYSSGYFSYSGGYTFNQRYFNKSDNRKWEYAYWTGLGNFESSGIWTDGTDIFYSGVSTQRVLDKTTPFTWTNKTWQGLTKFEGQYIWHDGDHIYYSAGSNQYELT